MRLGQVLRLVRVRRGLRQIAVARLAGVSQSTVSRVERGHIGPLSFDVVRRIAAVLDVRLDVVPRWRAGDLDRLLNARHSRFHELVARRFGGLPAWAIRPEVSFSIWGERGVIDILAFHSSRNALLVIELKTDIADVNELVGTVDRKRRLAVEIAQGQHWPVDARTRASIWVVVADTTTNRRRIAAHQTMLRAAFPTNGRTIGGWLRNPGEEIRALSIWSDSHGETLRADLRSVRRVRRREPAVNAEPHARRRHSRRSGSGRVREQPRPTVPACMSERIASPGRQDGMLLKRRWSVSWPGERRPRSADSGDIGPCVIS